MFVAQVEGVLNSFGLRHATRYLPTDLSANVGLPSAALHLRDEL
jgi:hypothetical protein